MTELVPVESIHFDNGEPLCAFQECYRCFEGREILFRLVNVEKKQWFFFNNTTDTIVHIRAVFAPGCVIKPLQRATMRVLPDAAGLSDDTCSTEVTLDVEPGYTESFIEGDVKSFHFEFRTETAPARDVVFEYSRPTVPYNKIYRCFKNNGNGLLFRLVDDSAHRWYFYNDTKDFMMRVSVTFANRAEVHALEKTTVIVPADPAVDEKSVDCVLFIEPGHTEAFIEGDPITYTLDFAAEPIPAAVAATKPAEEAVHYLHGSPDVSVIPHQSHVYRCFKEYGNGLLFRIVDDYNNIWAFYNDTTDYVMTANMRYPLSSPVQVAPGVQLMADTEREDGVVAAVGVPPLATVPFLVGTPATYELAFSANPVQSPSPTPTTSAGYSAVDTVGAEALTPPPAGVPPASGAAAPPPPQPPLNPPPPAPVAEESPHFEHGQPDASLMPRVDEVYKCFKDHGNGLLFRLVDVVQRRWAFYNDTTDVVASVQVTFPPSAQIQPLGKTEVATDPATGEVYYTVRVEPLETALFVEGDVETFTTKFMAERVHT